MSSRVATPKRFSPKFTVWAPALLLSASMGCAYGELRQVLRAEVASELDCPEVEVEPRNSEALRGTRDGDDQWKVRGCGVVRTYTCSAEGDSMTSYGNSGCTYVDGDVDAPQIVTDEGTEDLLGDPIDDAEPADAMDAPDAMDEADELDDDSGL